MTKHLGKFYLSDDNEYILSRYKEVNDLLKKAYWVKNRDEDTMLLAARNSLNFALCESESGRLAGYARVITDFATMYYLCDVFIDEKFRGMGLGKAIVEHIVSDDTRLRHLNGTLKTRDAQSLYEKYGFTESDVTCMFQNRNA